MPYVIWSFCIVYLSAVAISYNKRRVANALRQQRRNEAAARRQAKFLADNPICEWNCDRDGHKWGKWSESPGGQFLDRTCELCNFIERVSKSSTIRPENVGKSINTPINKLPRRNFH